MATVEELMTLCKEIEDNNIKPQNFQSEFEQFAKYMNRKRLILDAIVFSTLLIHLFSAYYNFGTLTIIFIMILQLSYINDHFARGLCTYNNRYDSFILNYRKEFADTFVYKGYIIKAVLYNDGKQLYFIRDVTFSKDDLTIRGKILRDYDTHNGYDTRSFDLKLKSD